MDLPSLRHFKDGQIFSDPVEVLVGEAWVNAVLCYADNGDQYWVTLDMAKLSPVTEWRYGKENVGSAEENRQGDGRVQTGNASKRQTGSRQRAKGQKPQAGNSNCAI